MHPLAWTLALGLLTLTSSGCSAPPSSPNRLAVQEIEPGSSPELESQALQQARGLFEQARDARARKDLDAARESAAKAIDLILGLTPGSLSLVEDQLLVELGALAHDLGDLKSALAARKRVVLEREGRGSSELDLANARLNLAITLTVLGDFLAARALFESVVEVRERTLPPDHADLAAARANLAATLFTLGDLSAAHAIFERVLEVSERTMPPDDPALALARGNLALTLRELGDLHTARALQERVLEVDERTLPPDHSDLAAARLNLAFTLSELGDLPAARKLRERVLEVWERTLPADHPNLAKARGNLALSLRDLGDLSAARALQERVLEVRERTLPPDHLDLAKARLSLAITLETLGDLAAARALEVRVLEVFERTLPPDHPNLAAARTTLVVTLAALGDVDGARALQERVLEVWERTLPPDHPNLAAALGNLAAISWKLGDIPTARALTERVLESRERTLPPDHPALARARGNLATMLRGQGHLSAARALEERVLEVCERTLPSDHPDLANARLNLAVTLGVLLGGGEEEQADEATRSALTTLALDLAHGLRRMAQSALLDGSPREVEERLASQAGELGRTISLARGFGFLDLGSDIAREAFLLSETSRAGGLIASRLAARAGSDGVGRELRARISRETEALARLAQSGGDAEALGQARTAVDQAGRELAQHASRVLGSAAPLEPTLEALMRGLGPKDALVAWRRTTLTTQRGDPPTLRNIDSLIAFVLRAGPPSAASESEQEAPVLELVDLGPIAPIEAAIERWRGLLGTPLERGVSVSQGPDDRAAAGQDVRALVLDPLRSALAGVERVIVALDDALHAIPLDALPAGEVWDAGGEPQRLLTDVLRIEVRSSLIELLLPEGKPLGEPTLLAIGHPAFDTDPASVEEIAETTGTLVAAARRSGESAGLLRGGMWERGFGTLPETRAEVRGVAQYFEDVFGEAAPALVLERGKASSTALIELAPKARWVHVATHGWFAIESVRSSADPEAARGGALAGLRLDETERVRGMSPMLLCGLALAGANLPMDSVGRIPGLVTAQEIAALDLSNCELAVLSACDTNVGVRRAGQGVASLQRALHMAGARSVITSLWKVPDEATKDLMLDFYRRLWVEKKPKHQALWEAKAKLRNARDERGNPRYATRDWAAWVLTGSPD